MEEVIKQLESIELFPLAKQSLDFDKVRGSLLGGALGDASGVPYEFKAKKYPFTGRLEYNGYLTSRWGYSATLAVGQVSDDSEMALVILNSILKTGGYNWKDVLQGYIDWCNSEGTRWIGKQTRALFKNIKTLKGYFNRRSKMILEGANRNPMAV